MSDANILTIFTEVETHRHTGSDGTLQVSYNDLTDTPAASGTYVISGESLTAGKPVWINPGDSTLYTSHGYLQSSSASFTYPSGATHQLAKLDSSHFLVLANSTNTLTVYVYDLSGSQITSATVTTSFGTSGHTADTSPNCAISRLSDSTFVIFYSNTTNLSLRYRTGSFNGTTITMDTDTAYPGSPDFCFCLSAVPADSDGKVAIAYADSTGSNGGGSAVITHRLSYLTCATNSVTVSQSIHFDATSGTFFAQTSWTQVCYSQSICYGLFAYNGSDGIISIYYAYIDTVGNSAGPINTIGQETANGTSASYVTIRPSFVGHNGCGYYGYQSGVNISGSHNTIWCLYEVSTSGSRIAWRHQTIAGGTTPDSGSTFIKLIGNECGVIMNNLYTDHSTTQGITIYYQRGNTYGADSSMTHAPIAYPASWYVLAKDQILFYNGSSIYCWWMPTPVDGFARSTVATATSVQLDIDGTTNQSTLSTNRNYYLLDSWSNPGDIANRGMIPVGLAVSTTQIVRN